MFSKKLVVILLLLGALVIVALLGISYKLGSKVRIELQTALNDYLERMVRDYASDDKPLSVKYDSFVCSGMSSYKCVSKHVALINTSTHQELMGISNLTLNIDDIGTGSVQVSLKSPSLSFEGFDKMIQESQNKETISIYEAFKPVSFECSEKDKMTDKYTGEITSHNQCRIIAGNTQYHYSLYGRIKSPNFADKTILNAMISYYSKFGFPEKISEEISDFEFAVDEISFSLASTGLKDILYPIFEVDYQSRKPQPKAPFNDQLYEKALGDLKNFIGFGLAISGLLENPYQEALREFIEGIQTMAMGKASKVRLALVPKQTPAPYFKIQPTTILNLDRTGTRQRIFAKILNNYNLIANTVLNEKK